MSLSNIHQVERITLESNIYIYLSKRTYISSRWRLCLKALRQAFFGCLCCCCWGGLVKYKWKAILWQVIFTMQRPLEFSRIISWEVLQITTRCNLIPWKATLERIRSEPYEIQYSWSFRQQGKPQSLQPWLKSW